LLSQRRDRFPIKCIAVDLISKDEVGAEVDVQNARAHVIREDLVKGKIRLVDLSQNKLIRRDGLFVELSSMLCDLSFEVHQGVSHSDCYFELKDFVLDSIRKEEILALERVGNGKGDTHEWVKSHRYLVAIWAL